MPDGRNPTYGHAKELLKRGLSEQHVAGRIGVRVEVIQMWFRDESGIRASKGGRKPDWMKRPSGSRFPYAAGRECGCGTVLNRYNPGPYCLVCAPSYEELAEAVA